MSEIAEQSSCPAVKLMEGQKGITLNRDCKTVVLMSLTSVKE